MKLKDTYRGADMFELARIFNASYDDVSVFGFCRFLIDNGYQIDYYEQEEPGDQDVLEDWRVEDVDWRYQWLDRELGELAMKPNALKNPKKFVAGSEEK